MFLFRIIEYGNNTSSSDKSYGIPVVLLVIEGGINTLRTVFKSMESDPPLPVVVAKGSGRIADILAYAYELHGCVLVKVREVRLKGIQALWWKHSFPTIVTRVEFIVGSRPCSESFFPGTIIFPSSQEPTFQSRWHFVLILTQVMAKSTIENSRGDQTNGAQPCYISYPFTIICIKNKSNGNINVKL